MTDEGVDSVLARLIEALAAQVDASEHSALAPGAVEALTGLSRSEAGLIFGHAGHLVHYGTDTEPIETLIQLISDIQRHEAERDAAILPGDRVRLAGELPTSVTDHGATRPRETVFTVRYVGDDATIDVQPDLTEDYTITSVPIATVQPARTQSTT